MRRRQSETEKARFTPTVLIVLGLISCVLAYAFLATVFGPSKSRFDSVAGTKIGDSAGESGGCCRGIDNLELWGPAVKWGADFKFNSSEDCCKACKQMCSGNQGPCLCDTWVFCGDKEACGSKYGECWLKKQKDVLAPDRQDHEQKAMWTSGLIFGRGEGIVALETEYGALHIKLHPECAPHSVNYILELLTLRHCIGCQFHRAESRGPYWDSEGNHIDKAPFGPPFALIQGILEAEGNTFTKIPTEHCPSIRRGSVAWVGSGPEFFISLANHQEWKKSYTVFGSLLPEDMEIAERIASLPTRPDVWNNINVAVLEKPVPLAVRRRKKVQDLVTNVG